MPWSTVLVQMHHADLKSFVRWMNLNQKYGNLENFSQIFCKREW